MAAPAKRTKQGAAPSAKRVAAAAITPAAVAVAAPAVDVGGVFIADALSNNILVHLFRFCNGETFGTVTQALTKDRLVDLSVHLFSNDRNAPLLHLLFANLGVVFLAEIFNRGAISVAQLYTTIGTGSAADDVFSRLDRNAFETILRSGMPALPLHKLFNADTMWPRTERLACLAASGHYSLHTFCYYSCPSDIPFDFSLDKDALCRDHRVTGNSLAKVSKTMKDRRECILAFLRFSPSEITDQDELDMHLPGTCNPEVCIAIWKRRGSHPIQCPSVQRVKRFAQLIRNATSDTSIDVTPHLGEWYEMFTAGVARHQLGGYADGSLSEIFTALCDRLDDSQIASLLQSCGDKQTKTAGLIRSASAVRAFRALPGQ
jgi:hypothetical protein